MSYTYVRVAVDLAAIALTLFYLFSFSVVGLACLVPERRAKITPGTVRHLLFIGLVVVVLNLETWLPR